MGSFSILTNVTSLQAQNYLRLNSNFQSQTINEVTSGLRIVNSGDDAAGLAIANGYRSDEAVLTQGIQNANDGLSQLQTADGGLSNISQLLDRARTLATESASGAFTGDRGVLNSEFQSVLTEINRQAQAIGLSQGGSLAKNLNVFVGGGQAGNGITATQNGTIGIDLSQSTVDTQSLGLTGVQASGAAGTDIGAGSATTSLSAILANPTNTGTEATPGYTTFNITGPGFSSGVNISVNTANLASTSDLVAAINAALTAAGSGGTQQATALSNAGIIAGINTDSTGKEQLTFSSSTAAFQVRAGDQVANALLGNFAQNATLTGTDAGPTVDTNTGGTSATLTLAVDGGSAFSVGVTVGAATSKAQIVKDLNANTSFNAVATAHLNGDQIVLESDNNTVHSEIQITGTTLATNLGLSTTAATSANPSTGASLNTYVTAADNTAAGATTFGAAGAGTITFQFQGAGQTTPTNVALNVTAGTTVAQAITALGTAVAGNAALQTAGITLNTATPTDALGFKSSSGQSFNVQVTGDTQDLLGFGSFVTGANGAVDYNSLGASSNYNDATAAGTNTFEFSLNGAASNTNAVAVDLTAGDATAATLTSTDTSGAPVEVTANNNVLNLAVNGQSFTVTLTPGGNTTKNSIADQINTAIAAQGTATVVNNAIVIASNTKGAGGSVQIQNGINSTANTLLGFAAGASATGTSRTGASVAQALNQYFASNSALQSAGLVADYNVTTPNRITIQSSNDTFFRVNSFGDTGSAATEGTIQEGTRATAGAQTSSVTTSTVVAGTSSDFNIAIDGGAVHNITVSAGVARTAQSIATELNGNALFAGATASVDGTGHLIISSNTTGAGSSIALTAGTHDALGVLGLTATTSTGVAASAGYNITGANDKVSVSIDGGAAQVFTLTNGANQTTADIATDLAGLVGATASDDNGHLNITSNSTGTSSSVLFNATANSAYATLGITAGTTYSGSAAQTGFGDTGVSFTGNLAGAAPVTSPSVDVGGASQTAALAFTPVANGGDNQTISLSAADATGAQQSLSVTLSNNGTSRNGESIDQALNAINTALLQSNNSTLQKIVAVKDDSTGSEQIRFLSTLPAFQVSIGSTPDAAGVGSQGTTAASTVSNGGATADISNITSAVAAVSALANSVSLLGNSQAVVGRGENQFNYAINLAQSQLTNTAAAESSIRDANLAAESANLTKAQILLQAGVAALAQANAAPQNILKLLQ